MKKYFKKIGIMLVMALVVIGFGMIHNGTVANAATVGQQLTSPENGWKRIDGLDSKILYTGTWQTALNDSNWYAGSRQVSNDTNATVTFKFKGTKLRIIGPLWNNFPDKVDINIDGNTEAFNSHSTGDQKLTVLYEKLNLSNAIHVVNIKTDPQSTTSLGLFFDAIDIDDTAYLINPTESITLDKSSMDLTEGDSGQLTATTTPSAIGVTWKSSDSSVATVEVDPTNGKIIKVNAIKEGTCTITATAADGSNLSASCTVNVTKTDNTGAILIINLTDGETKVFDVSSSEVDNFKSWYNNKSEFENKLTYVFNKTVNSNISVEEDVVHDQITSFEIRKY